MTRIESKTSSAGTPRASSTHLGGIKNSGRTIILFLVFVAVGGWSYFNEWEKPASQKLAGLSFTWKKPVQSPGGISQLRQEAAMLWDQFLHLTNQYKLLLDPVQQRKYYAAKVEAIAQPNHYRLFRDYKDYCHERILALTTNLLSCVVAVTDFENRQCSLLSHPTSANQEGALRQLSIDYRELFTPGTFAAGLEPQYNCFILALAADPKAAAYARTYLDALEAAITNRWPLLAGPAMEDKAVCLKQHELVAQMVAVSRQIAQLQSPRDDQLESPTPAAAIQKQSVPNGNMKPAPAMDFPEWFSAHFGHAQIVTANAPTKSESYFYRLLAKIGPVTGNTNPDEELRKGYDLRLNGLLYATNRAIAFVNEASLGEGETTSIHLENKLVKLRCINIFTNTVIVQVNDGTPHILTLLP